MEYFVEVKLQKDAYSGGYASGLTMCNSQTVAELNKVSEEDGKTVYENARKHQVIVTKEQRDDVTFVTTTFANGGDEDAVLEMLASFAIKGVKADKIYRMQSFWSAEGKLRAETINELHLEPSWCGNGVRIEKFGTTGSMPVRKYFPFLALEDTQSGEFIGIQLYTPASWQIEINGQSMDNSLSVVGGMADRDFGHWMKTIRPGEAFTTPRAAIACGNSLYDVCDKLVKAQKPDISPVDNDMAIMFNEYCTTWGNPNIDNIKRICDQLKGKGIKYLIMDSGWYGDEYWWNCIGDWEINEEKFPGGLKPMADYIRANGMIPGIWYEFETVSRGSKHYDDVEHLIKKDGVPLSIGDRRFFDMTQEWVIDYLSEKVIKLLKDCGFGYIKVDYNDTLGIGCDDPDSLGEGLRKRVEATQEFFRKIKKELPDMVIENCSSGGHRLESSMMEIVSQASFSDAHETKSMPIIAANLHRVVKPEQSQIWAVLREKDDADRIRYSLINTYLGRMCLSGDVCNLSDEQWKLIEEGMAFYNKVSDIIRDGKTILIDCQTESYNHPKGEQLVIRQLGNRYLAIAHRFEESKAIDVSFMDGAKMIDTYGDAKGDFTAQAWLYEK